LSFLLALANVSLFDFGDVEHELAELGEDIVGKLALSLMLLIRSELFNVNDSEDEDDGDGEEREGDNNDGEQEEEMGVSRAEL